MQESTSQLKKETCKERFLFFWMGFRVVVYLATIPIPFFIDGVCGHIWGAVAAVANIIAWLYFGLKAHLAPGSRLLWIGAFVFVVLVAAKELSFFFVAK